MFPPCEIRKSHGFVPQTQLASKGVLAWEKQVLLLLLLLNQSRFKTGNRLQRFFNETLRSQYQRGAQEIAHSLGTCGVRLGTGAPSRAANLRTKRLFEQTCIYNVNILNKR